MVAPVLAGFLDGRLWNDLMVTLTRALTEVLACTAAIRVFVVAASRRDSPWTGCGAFLSFWER